MGRLPAPLKVLIVAAIATAVGFPLLSVRGDGPGATVTARALVFGATVAWVGLAGLALRWLASLRRGEAGRIVFVVVALLAQQVAFGLLVGSIESWREPWRALLRVALEGSGSIWKVAVVALEAPVLLALLLRLAACAGLWRGAPAHAAQVRSLMGHRAVAFPLAGALVVLAAVLPYVMPGQHLNLAVETLIYMTLALGLNVVVGYAGLLVLGYAGFWAIGAYTFAILALRLDVSMWLAFPIAGGVAMVAGFLLGLPSLRLRGDYLAIVTLGFGEVVYYFLKTEVSLTGGEMGLPNKDIRGSRLHDHTAILGSGPLIEPRHFYWPALALVVLAVVVIWRVERSRVGRALVAMREDETAARCMGIDTTRLKLVAFAFSAMWAGLAGVLWAAKTDYTNPMYFKFMDSVIILSMVVLGGMGSIPGAMIGAVLLYAGPALLREYLPQFQDFRLLLFGAIMILLMVFRPQGLLGSARLKVELKGAEDGG